MRRIRSRRKTRLSEEEAFERFNRVFDFESYCLELEYSETIGAAIREGIRKALDRKQRAFDAVLAVHPTTRAENARRAEARRLEEERLEKAAVRKNARERRAMGADVERLARRWGAQLVRRAG